MKPEPTVTIAEFDALDEGSIICTNDQVYRVQDYLGGGTWRVRKMRWWNLLWRWVCWNWQSSSVVAKP